MIAYLQTLGGTPSVTLQTKHRYNGGTAAPAAAPAPGGAPADATPTNATPTNATAKGPVTP